MRLRDCTPSADFDSHHFAGPFAIALLLLLALQFGVQPMLSQMTGREVAATSTILVTEAVKFGLSAVMLSVRRCQARRCGGWGG